MNEVRFFVDRTDPLIDEGTVLVLVQDGTVEVSRYHAPDPDDFGPTLSHPMNAATLNPEALKLIRQAFPDFEQWDRSRIFVCPSSIAEKAIWEESLYA